MTKYAEYSLSITSEGKWKGLCYSYPPKELGENEIMLNYKEYKLLKELKSLEQGYELLDSVKEKINEQTK